ncbi:multicopper oxidase family protein [Halobacteriaceae archaeon GCM10025711]
MLASMGAIGAGAALGGAGTMAFFSDTEEFDGNELVAGELDLKVDWQQRYYGPDGWVNVNAFPDENGDDVQDDVRTREEIAQAEYGKSLADLTDSERQAVEDAFRAQFADVPDQSPAPLIDISDVKPGDKGEVTFSLHLFDNPGYIQMVGDLTENLENGVTEPELSDEDEDDPGDGSSDGELAQAIQAWVWYDENGNNEMDDGEKVFASGRLVDVLAQLRNGLTLDGDRDDPSRQCFPNSTTEHIGFKWKLDVDHANEVQTDSIEFSLGFRAEQCRHNDKGPNLEPYQDELPTLDPVDYTDGGTVEITMQQSTHTFHEDLPETTVWGYHDGYLGPNIEAMKDVPLSFRYVNDLPTEHLLPVDKTIHGPGPFDDPAPEVRAVTHLHGGNVPDEVDGYPETWTTPDGQRNSDTPVPYPDGAASGDTVEYEYPNTQPASQLWFHDHALGITRLNVYAGLAGLYTLRDQNELDLLEEDGTESEAIPSGEYEIPLILQDKSFTEDGELFYPDGLPVENPDNTEFDDYPAGAEGSVVPEFFGDTAVVNGKVWPYLEVEPRKYRFRMLNACNSRFLGLKLFEWDEESHTIDLDAPGPGFTLIGSDGGLFESPMDVEDRLLMNPANRFDVVIDFSGYEGQDFVLHNNARSPFKAETQAGDEQPLPEFMLFRVQDTTPTQPGPDSLPTDLATIPDLGTPDDEPYFSLEEGEDEFGRLQLLLNDLRVGGANDPDPELWPDPVTTSVTEGETQVWNLINLTEDVHPIHLHLVQFQIVGRKAFDVDGFIADGRPADMVDDYVGEDLPLNERQQGWHDTVAARPGELTQVKATWGEFTADGETFFGDHVAADSDGDLFPWHCHILEHEDHEMMRPYEVNPRP